MEFYLVFPIVFLFYILFDILWFSLFSYQKIYQPQLLLMNKKQFGVRKYSALVTYLILSLGLSLLLEYTFVSTLFDFFVAGFLYGFVVYGVYNVSNFATIEKYKFKTVIMDILWGSVVSGMICIFLHLIVKPSKNNQ